MGDFNSVMNAQEWVGGSAIRPYHFVDFHDYITITGLQYMRFLGNYLTWSNRQEHRINSKLDRVLVNDVWCGAYPNYEVKFVNPVISSNHSYMLIKEISWVINKWRAFMFFNFWVQEEGFYEAV